MTVDPPRLRMFAGPNGSGKTTVKNNLNRPASWFGVYINPDDIEKELRETGHLPLARYSVHTTTAELRQFFHESPLFNKQQIEPPDDLISVGDGKIDGSKLEVNSYHASVLADFLRRKALDSGISFSFETVMSSPDKVGLLRDARNRGYRTYLYYVATEDPAINIARVKYRVAEGGHDVPNDKIVSRYHRSIQLLGEAIRNASRGFLFDTSEEQAWWFAQSTDGVKLELKSDEMPNWFKETWDHF